MIEHPLDCLLLHGSLVFLIGVLSGFPYWLGIILNWNDETKRFWRVTHSFLVVFGLTMLVFALIIPKIILSPREVRVLTLAMIIAGYGFILAFTAGSLKKIRGLTPKPYGLNTILFACHVIGITGSLLGTTLLISGLFRYLF